MQNGSMPGRGGPSTFTVFVARYAGARRTDRPALASRSVSRNMMREVRRLAEVDSGGDPGLHLGQLALRRCYYLIGEMFLVDRKHPEAGALLARAIIETALVGSYLVLEPAVSERFVKKQASYSRRLRARILTTNRDELLDVLADVEFLAAPLADHLDTFKAAPDFAGMASQLDRHPPFQDTALATYLYDEGYSFLSNYVEHPTPLSLARHSRVLPYSRGWRRYSPRQRVHRMTLTHVASPGIGALASCIARRMGRDHTLFDEWALEAQYADGRTWPGSPLRYATVTATLESIDLNPLRANALGAILLSLGTADEFRFLTASEQLVAVLEAMRAAREQSALRRFLLGGQPIGGARPLNFLEVPSKELESDAEVTIAALFLAYAGLWPTDPGGLRDLIGLAAAGVADVEPGIFDRVSSERRPTARIIRDRVRQRLHNFE